MRGLQPARHVGLLVAATTASAVLTFSPEL